MEAVDEGTSSDQTRKQGTGQGHGLSEDLAAARLSASRSKHHQADH
jgi:hypothetical protein